MNEQTDITQATPDTLEKFDRSLGTDELNLCEFPLASLSTRTKPGQSTLHFEDSVYDSGTSSTVHRTLLVTGSEHFGLPTATDNDILLLLVHLTNVRNRFKNRRVEFSRYELIRFLGWKQDGRSYKRLDESLRRWTTVTLHYKHAWWDRSGRRWKSRSFHVIGSLELRGRGDCNDDGRSSFTWDEVIFASFTAGNLKRIDLNVYFNLKWAVSRQMYRFLDKRFWHKSRLEFDLRQFATEHIGLSRNYDNHELKRKLKPALKELQEVGFLEPSDSTEIFRRTSPGKWLITLTRSKSPGQRKSAATPMERELTNRGVNSRIAGRMVSEFSSDYISEKIQLHDSLVAGHDRRVSRNPAGFLAAAIRDNYTSPKEKGTQSRRSVTALTVARMAHADQKPAGGRASADSESKSRQSLAFQGFWNSLSEVDQQAFEHEAISRATVFHQQTLQRRQGVSCSLADELRKDLVQEHWVKNGSKKQ